MNWKKLALLGGGAFALLLILFGTVYFSRKNVIVVQTGRAAKQDIRSVVTASGEIKPKTYVNIGANGFGKITKLLVKEGDQVKQGQLLAQLDPVQSSADVQAQRAALEVSNADSIAADAGFKTAMANLAKAKSDADMAKLDYDRAVGLYKDQLIAKSDYDAKVTAWQAAQATLEQAKAGVAQAKAQRDSAQLRIKQSTATLTHATDVFSKTQYVAPFDGVVTNLPVREGETVVMGIQNAPGSTLMTIADMSVITAEVKVDETDIIDVKNGQAAEITIDAIPGKVFHGHVTEIGDNAIVRSTGVSTSQSTGSSQEAKDFKVVVQLDDPPANLRPGLSTTAKITTGSVNQALSIPIQALTVRKQSELQQRDKNAVQAAAPSSPDTDKELQGVFVVRKGRAEFVPVETGLEGTTDIEVKKGLQEGDEIVTGSYKVLRSLKNNSAVRVDNSTPAVNLEGS